MTTKDSPLIVAHQFHKNINEVWKAITNHADMVQWFFENIADFKAEVGFHTEFNVKASSRDFMHLWTIEEVIPNQKLVYRWRYQGLEGDSRVLFELAPIGSQKTKLTLTVIILEDFDQRVPEFTQESCLEGWNYFIKDRLKSFLDL